MQLKGLFALVLLLPLGTLACRYGNATTPDLHHSNTPPAATFKEHCDSFEILNFGNVTAARLAGYAWLGSEPPQPLQGVQIAAKANRTGELRYSVSSTDGAYELASLPPGQYEVWTCIEGFDELRFQLLLDPHTTTTGVDLYLTASEGPGRPNVVVIEEPR